MCKLAFIVHFCDIFSTVLAKFIFSKLLIFPIFIVWTIVIAEYLYLYISFFNISVKQYLILMLSSNMYSGLRIIASIIFFWSSSPILGLRWKKFSH